MDSSITFLSLGRKWSASPVLYAPTRIPTWWGRPTKMASLRSVTTGGVSVQDLVHSTWNLPSKFKSDSHKWVIANHTWLVITSWYNYNKSRDSKKNQLVYILYIYIYMYIYIYIYTHVHQYQPKPQGRLLNASEFSLPLFHQSGVHAFTRSPVLRLERLGTVGR